MRLYLELSFFGGLFRDPETVLLYDVLFFDFSRRHLCAKLGAVAGCLRSDWYSYSTFDTVACVFFLFGGLLSEIILPTCLD